MQDTGSESSAYIHTAIVILNYCNWRLTEKCVQSLFALNCRIQVVVVDNCSTDDSFTQLTKLHLDNENVKILQNPINSGYAAGNNFGFRYIARKFPEIQYYCIINPDVIVTDSGIFKKLEKQFVEDERLAAISPLMILNGTVDLDNSSWNIPGKTEIFTHHFLLYKKHAHTTLHANCNMLCKVEAIPGSFFIIRKSVMEKIGYLDEHTFLYNEENILAAQIKQLGMYNGIAAETHYWHNHLPGERRQTIKEVIKNYRIGNNSRRYLCKKYYPKWCLGLLQLVCAINMPLIVMRHLVGNIRHRNDK